MDDPESAWRILLAERYRSAVADLVERYPEQRSVTVDAVDLHGHDADLASALFEAPDATLRAARAALRGFDDGLDHVNVRIESDPGLVRLEALRTRHLGELVTVEGDVTDVGPVRTMVDLGVFACVRCGERTERHQAVPELRTPRRCPHCEAPADFELDRERSRLIDVQRVRLSGTEDRSGGRAVDLYLDDDLVGRLGERDRTLATCIARLGERSGNRFGIVLDAVGVSEEPRAEPESDTAADAVRSLIEAQWAPDTAG